MCLLPNGQGASSSLEHTWLRGLTIPGGLLTTSKCTGHWAKGLTYVISFLKNGSLYLRYSWTLGQVAFGQGLWVEPVWIGIESPFRETHTEAEAERPRTLASTSGSASCDLSGVRQVTLSLGLLFSHLSNEDITPTPFWVAGMLNRVKHPAQLLA